MRNSFSLTLANLEDTALFARTAAKTLLDLKEKGKLMQTVYLYGEMGIGKTAFTRAFVGALPNAENAEVASPSFTLCHEYPTNPEIYHADLYRLPDCADLPEELRNIGKNAVLLLEWAERLHPEAKGENRLEIFFSKENLNLPQKNASQNIDNFVNVCELKRHVNIIAHGDIASEFLQLLTENLQNCFFVCRTEETI